jgi:putative colanic acid biosysnthesis UDP-glucose lipid carrier transferase
MNEAVVAKSSLAFAVSAVRASQAIAPAFIAVVCLYGVIVAYDMPLMPFFHFLAIIVALLTFLLMHPPAPGRTAYGLQDSFPLSIALLLRWLVVLGALLALGYVTRFSQYYPRRIVLTWACLTPALTIGAALALRELLDQLLSNPANARKAVIAGCTESSQALADRLVEGNDSCLALAGFFDDRGGDRLNVNSQMRLLGKLADLPEFVKKAEVDVVFVALPIRHLSRVMALVDALRDTTASIYYVPDIGVFDLIQSQSASMAGIPVISMCETPFYGHRVVAKRIMDVTLAATMLLLLAPVMLLMAVLIHATSAGPVIFKQRRYGLNGEQIVIRKFRTMTVVEDGASIVQVSKADSRLTKLGQFLRRYSLDELPQLINVLQGSMSLVGPRPHAVAHNELFRTLIKGYMVRHKVLPGMTGWAQVNGLRGETKTLDQMEARVRYDLEYLRRWSLKFDLEILLKTALRVLNDSNAV